MKPNRWKSILAALLLATPFLWSEPSLAQYNSNGDGTVADTHTGLIWQQAGDGVERTFLDALAYCESLSLADQSDWRLPNARELESLVASNGHMPAIDPLFGCNLDGYWTGSPYDLVSVWVVYFRDGEVDYNTVNTLNYVRCVRGGP